MRCNPLLIATTLASMTIGCAAPTRLRPAVAVPAISQQRTPPLPLEPAVAGRLPVDPGVRSPTTTAAPSPLTSETPVLVVVTTTILVTTTVPSPGTSCPNITIDGSGFDADSWAIPDSIRDALADAAAKLRQQPFLLARVTGHTDHREGLISNDELSQRRAEAVGDALVAMGVPHDRLIVSGLGARQQVSSDNTADGRALNRRVQIIAFCSTGQ